MTALAEVTDATPFDTCACSYAVDARGKEHESSYRRVHDDLLAIEDADPIDAVAMCTSLVEGAMVGEELMDLDVFAGEHNWRNPVQVFQALHHVQWCKEKVWEATRRT
jgi:hypothetical protein